MNFGQFLQIGIVVQNVDVAIKEYEKFGIGPWEFVDFNGKHIPGFTEYGEPGNLEFKGAMCQFSGFEIELIQPVSEGIFTEWLREHGPGVHHLAFVPKEGFDGFVQEFKGNGNHTIIEALFGDGNHGFTYLDTFKQLGFYSEIHKGRTE